MKLKKNKRPYDRIRERAEARKTIRDALETRVLIPTAFTTPDYMCNWLGYYPRRNIYAER